MEKYNKIDNEALLLLKAVAEWWDAWIVSENPQDIGDLPIKEIKQYLMAGSIDLTDVEAQ